VPVNFPTTIVTDTMSGIGIASVWQGRCNTVLNGFDEAVPRALLSRFR
jgi:hypothetical protein